MVALEEMAVNLPEISEESSGARARARLVAPPSSSPRFVWIRTGDWRSWASRGQSADGRVEVPGFVR